MDHDYKFTHKTPLGPSSKLESFHLKCARCGSVVIIHSDPKSDPLVLELLFNQTDMSFEPCVHIPKEFL